MKYKHWTCSRDKVSTQCFLASVSLLLHQKTLTKSHLYFPCSWSFVVILMPAFFWFPIYIFSAIVYFDTGQNVAHDLYDEQLRPEIQVTEFLAIRRKDLQTVPQILPDLSCQQISSHHRGLVPYFHSCSRQQSKLV